MRSAFQRVERIPRRLLPCLPADDIGFAALRVCGQDLRRCLSRIAVARCPDPTARLQRRLCVELLHVRDGAWSLARSAVVAEDILPELPPCRGRVRMRSTSLTYSAAVNCFNTANDAKSVTPEQVVFSCNKRCDQENLIAQLKSGVRSLCAPSDNLLSNGAYMLMTSLAWTLKAWSALLLPISPRHRSKHEAERTRLLTMEFRTFLDQMIHVPCQIIRHARKVVYRLLNWTDLTPAF